MGHLLITDEDGTQTKINAKPGKNFMAILRDNDYDIPAICGGTCACGTCHILIEQDWNEQLTKPLPEEKDLLEKLENYDEDASRLACQIDYHDALDGLSLTICEN